MNLNIMVHDHCFNQFTSQTQFAVHIRSDLPQPPLTAPCHKQTTATVVLSIRCHHSYIPQATATAIFHKQLPQLTKTNNCHSYLPQTAVTSTFHSYHSYLPQTAVTAPFHSSLLQTAARYLTQATTTAPFHRQ